eukprot:3024283-Amphidinium_carterae.1
MLTTCAVESMNYNQQQSVAVWMERNNNTRFKNGKSQKLEQHTKQRQTTFNLQWTSEPTVDECSIPSTAHDDCKVGPL